MSLLNPGGLRSGSDFRIFGFENIRRAIQRRGRTYDARGSIALGNRHIRNIRTGKPAPHEHAREIARRQRQNARKAANA